ncbi:hypothetical protein ACLK2H_05995 [Escherichia coli]
MGKTTTQDSTSSSVCTAWVSRCMEQVVGKVADGKLNRPCRIYAPGRHPWSRAFWCVVCWKTAPTPRSLTVSPDSSLPLDELVADPVLAVEKMALQEGAAGWPHPENSAAAALLIRQWPVTSVWIWRS